MRDQYGFTEEEREAILRLVQISIKQGTPLSHMFTGNDNLAREAELIYSEIYGAKTGAGIVPDQKDKRDVVVGSMPSAKKDFVDWRAYCTRVEHQGRFGSCTAHAGTSAAELLKRETERIYQEKSRFFLWWNGRSFRNVQTKDTGIMIREMVKAMKKWGLCDEALWPYKEHLAFMEPSKEAYEDGAKNRITKYMSLAKGDVEQAKSICECGYPIVFGMDVFEEMENWETMSKGFLPMPQKTNGNPGGHAVLMVGYNNPRGYFIVKNSWGPVWGDQGYLYMPYSYYEKYTFDPWTIQKER